MVEFWVVGWKEGRCVGIGAGVGSISSVGPTSEAEASVAQGGEDELAGCKFGVGIFLYEILG